MSGSFADASALSVIWFWPIFTGAFELALSKKDAQVPPVNDRRTKSLLRAKAIL